MRFARIFFIITVLTVAVTVLFSCEEDTDMLEHELLFTMPIGRMEDQLFVQQIDGVNTLAKTRIFMKDGFIFISNGESAKVMEFNSFGDLISLYYNGDVNPAPVILGTGRDSGSDVTRAAYEYPLNDPGEIVKTNSGDLLIDDRISEQRREFDEEKNVMLDRIILRFNDHGELVSYLGQEGPGGTPFPYIHGLYVNAEDQIIVVTRNSGGWKIFWFTDRGDPLFRIDFTNELIPKDEDAVTLSIENIVPDIYEHVLYLKIDYYTENEAKMIKFYKSAMLGYDLDAQAYSMNMDLPRNIVRSEQPVIFEEKEHEYLNEFVGVARGPSFFLISPYEGAIYRLTVVSEDGAVKGRGLIDFSDEDIFFRSYQVNPDGIFSAIICREYDAEIIWWRSDRFVEELQGEFGQFMPNEGN